MQYSVLESTMSSLESNEKRMEWKKYVGQCTSIENKNKYSILDVHTYIFVCRKTCILSPNQNYFILLRVYSILVFILIAQIQLNVLLVIRVYRTPRLVLLELRLWIGPRDRWLKRGWRLLLNRCQNSPEKKMKKYSFWNNEKICV